MEKQANMIIFIEIHAQAASSTYFYWLKTCKALETIRPEYSLSSSKTSGGKKNDQKLILETSLSIRK